MSLTSAFKTASGDVTFTISSGSATISDTDTFDILEIGQLEIDVADIQGGSDSIEVYERLGNIDITVYDVLGDGSSRMYAVLANALQDPNQYLQVDMLLVANDTNLGTSTTRFLLYREGIEFDVDSDETKLKLVAKPKSGYIAESNGEDAPTFPPATSEGFDIGFKELSSIRILPSEKYNLYLNRLQGGIANAESIDFEVTKVTSSKTFIDKFIRYVYNLSITDDIFYSQAVGTFLDGDRQLISDNSFYDTPISQEPSNRVEIVIPTDTNANYPNFRAVDIVSRLAAQEGSYFGALFGKGYFINRYANTGNIVELDYDNILELSIESSKEKVAQVTSTLSAYEISEDSFLYRGGIKAKKRYARFENGKSFDTNTYILSQLTGNRLNNGSSIDGILVNIALEGFDQLAPFYEVVASTSSLAYANMLGLTVAKNIRVKLNGIGSLMPYNRVQFTSDARFPNFNITVGGQPVNYRPYKFKYDIVNDEVEAWLFPILQDSDIALIDDSIADVDLVRPEIVNIEGNVQIVYPKPRFDILNQGILPVTIVWNDVFGYTNEGSEFPIPSGQDDVLINSLLDVASPIAQYIESDFQAENLRQIFYYTIGGDTSILPSAGETIYIHTAGAKIEAVVEQAGVFSGNLYRAVLQEPISGYINGGSFISRDGVENRWTDIVYYVEFINNSASIKSTPLTVWNNTLAFRDKSKYVEAWTLTADGSIGFTDPSAPYAKLVMSDVAKRMNNAQDVSKDAILREIIAGFRANAVFELGANVNGEITALPVNPSFTNRVNLPIGTRLLVVSGDETYDVIVSADTDAGALSIPIQSEYVVAYKGAKVLFDSAFIQSQLLVQPSNVYVYAQSVNGNATSALNLATTNESAIASINTTFTNNGITNSTNITSRVDAVGSRIVLGVNGAGNIARFSIEANTFGTTVDINANQINLTGQTNFYSQMNNLFSTGVLVTPSGQEIIRSDDAPTQRGDGSALQSGDMWIDTNDGDRPYSYNGSVFVRAYTSISGGDIQTGTVDTDQLSANAVTASKADLASIFSSQITINSSGYIQSQGYNAGAQGFRLDANGNAELNNAIIRGSLDAVTGTFAGDLSAVGGTFTGTLSGVDGTFAGQLQAVTGSFGNTSVTGILTVNGSIVVGSGGFIRGNSYEPSIIGTGEGYYLGAIGGTHQFAVGKGNKYIHFNGETIEINNTTLQSNYSAGVSGWQINSLGDAEFNDVTVRGDVYTTNGSLGGSIIDTDALKSSNFVIGTSGWRIRSTGDAEFNNVTVRGVLDGVTGTLGDLTVNGTLSLGTGGISSTNFNVSSTGAITATSANISGTITSSNGTIGGMTVNSNGFGLVGGGGLYSQIPNPALNGEGSTSLGSVDMKGLYIDANNWVGGYGQDLQSSTKLARFGNTTNYIVVGDNAFKLSASETMVIDSAGLSIKGWNISSKPQLGSSPSAMKFNNSSNSPAAFITGYYDSISHPSEVVISIEARDINFSLSSPRNITGSRGGNVALANLLTQLASIGLITNSTSA